MGKTEGCRFVSGAEGERLIWGAEKEGMCAVQLRGWGKELNRERVNKIKKNAVIWLTQKCNPLELEETYKCPGEHSVHTT